MSLSPEGGGDGQERGSRCCGVTVRRRELNSWGVTPKEEGIRCGPGPIAESVARPVWPLSAETVQASPKTSLGLAVTLSQLH